MKSPAPAKDQMLLRGLIVLMIGATVLLGPHILRSAELRELLRGATVAGWFALALGTALVCVDLLRRWRQRQH